MLNFDGPLANRCMTVISISRCFNHGAFVKDHKGEAFNRYFSSVFNSDDSLPNDFAVHALFWLSYLVSHVNSRRGTIITPVLRPDQGNLPRRFSPKNTQGMHWTASAFILHSLQPVIKPGDIAPQTANSQILRLFSKKAIPNYRPISLLWRMSKVCERCVLVHLIPKLHKPLSSLQHVFVSGKSCVTQLLSVLYKLGVTLDAGRESDVVYLDFSKAFDSVPHRKLLHKLSLFGISGSLLCWVLWLLNNQNATCPHRWCFLLLVSLSIQSSTR